MGNLEIGISLIIFALAGVPVAVTAFINRDQIPAAGWLTALCISDTLWAVISAMVYLVPSEKLAFLFQNIKLAFVCSSTILVYLLALWILKNRGLDKVILCGIFMFPAITFVLGLTDDKHGLLIKSLQYYQENGVRVGAIVNGPWFWIHCVVCYVFVLMTAHLIIKQMSRLPGKYRTPAMLLLISLIICVAASVCAILEVFPYSLDLAPYSAIITQIMVYFALCNPNSMEMLLSSREAIFEQSKNPMFILNLEKEIIDYNKEGKKVISRLAVQEPSVLPYQTLYEYWVTSENFRVFEEDRSIFTVQEENRDIHYQEVTMDLYNRKNAVIGSVVEIKNITPIMSLIHKLQDSAYFDNLTGLHNRNYFMRIIQEWGEKNRLEREVLPLGILVGDVNGLKRVNDTYGHAKGDKLLQLVASELAGNKPERGLAFRMGGDEFAVLIPQSNEAELKAYLDVIEQKDYSLVDEEFVGTGIAVSYLLKTDNKVSVMESIHEADILMYQKKHNRRR